MPIITITTPNSAPQRFEISANRETVTLGRSSKSDIKISCESVSGSHATIRRLPDGYVLRDLGSTNGTKLKGKRVSEIHLEEGQDIKLGDVIFTFVPDPGAAGSSANAKTAKLKAVDEPQTDTELQSGGDSLVLGLSLMGGGLIVLGFVVLIGMEAIKAIADRDEKFIIGGCLVIGVGLLCLVSILFVTGKIKLPKLAIQFDDEDDDEEEEEDRPKRKKKKRNKKKKRDEEDEEEEEDSDDDSDDKDDSDEDTDEDKDDSDENEELGKGPKEESKKED